MDVVPHVSELSAVVCVIADDTSEPKMNMYCIMLVKQGLKITLG